MRSFLLLVILAVCGNFSFAQTENTAPAVPDSVPAKSTLTLAAVYSNNASYYGQRAKDATPYAAVAASYQLKSGFYFSGQAFRLLNDNSSDISAAGLGAGFNFPLSKKISADISYSHSFYPSYSPLLQAANADGASLSLSRNGWVVINLTGDYAFGKINDAFATGAISKSINLFSPGTKDVVSINPSADVVGGTQHFYQSYVTNKKLHDSLLGLPIPGLGNPGRGGGESRTDTVVTTSFNILSYNFKLPLSYSRSHYVLEAAWQLSLLSNYAETSTGKANSFLTFSFYYQF